MNMISALSGWAVAEEAVPLVVDVDGTLIRTDLLHEAALQFMAHHPLQSWHLIAWAMAGKAALKGELAARVDCGAATLPLQDAAVAAIRTAQAEGRPVYLASASERRYVEAIAERIGGITGVFATDAHSNLAGAAKAERLVEAFGERGFDYIGNCKADYPVWKAARTPLAVSGSPGFTRRVAKAFPGSQLVAEQAPRARDYLRALRMHQWAKNVLVFLPLLAGHTYDAESIGRTILAFLCFCMAASSAYIINDLLDLPGDRAHPRKRNRPFASGAIPVAHGPPMAALLLAAAVGGSLLLPIWFFAVLTLYVSATLAYSLVLKRKLLIDVITLGALYTVRVLGGVAAVGVEQSPWLLMFSLFLFLCLAVVKRCSELVARREAGGVETLGRGYRVEDLNVLLGLAAAAGYGAVLVVALYISSPEVQLLYSHPQALWLICPMLLYWVSRVAVLSNRGVLHDDPVVFALTDRVSWAVGALAASVVALAI
jgi:4-hydroxybenzoate polyprenyltransferase/phosphoserine phosphatase